jgi:ABC-type multidrug transport system fused ATPase/permease subunit
MSRRKLIPWLRTAAASVGIGLQLMTASERRRAVLLTATALLNGLLQTAAIVAIVPVVQLMIDPGFAGSRFMAWLGPLFGGEDQRRILLLLGVFLILLIVAKTIFSWLQIGWMARFSAACETRLSHFLMRRVLHAPYPWLVRQNTARLRILLFGFVSVWSRDFVRSLMKLMNDLFVAACTVALLIWAHPVSGLMVAGAVGLVGIAIFAAVRPELVRLADIKRRGIVGANTVSTEAVLGVKEVKMAAAEDRFAALFNEQVRSYANADARAQQWTQLPRHTLELLAFGALIALGAVVVIWDLRSPEFATIVLLYAVAALRLLPIFATVVGSMTTLVGAFPQIANLEQLIRATAESDPSATPPREASDWVEIRLDDVSLRYPDAMQDALGGVSATIRRGGSYGIVGPSGAGKSTFIDLVAALIEPTGGAMLVDSRRLSANERSMWRRRFGYVAQRPFLLDASLRSNVTFDPAAPIDEQRLERAIRLARLEQVVARLPGGLKGRVGEQGALLSGGERQRLAIARALYRGADLLILDEATSSLDTLVEREIAESIASLRGEVTTIIVSHHLNLVRDCDEIWVFDKASLVAKGTHERLMSECELYRRMVDDPDTLAPGPDDIGADRAATPGPLETIAERS